MSILVDTLLDLLPPDSKINSAGWHTFNCPCCVSQGESRNDTKHRGNLEINGSFIRYNCFNCKFAFSFNLTTKRFSKKLIVLLEELGMSSEEISLLEKNHKYENNENQPSEKTVTKKTKSYSLPEDCRPLKGDFQSKNYVEVIDYLTKRNKNLLSIDLRWCISQPGLFIPCIRYNNVVGYIIRNLNGKENQSKYIKYIPDGYIFNEDILRSDKKNILVFEGALDALLGNGIALLTNALTEQQAEQLKKYDKHFILVPDRDVAGKKMYESFVKYGISCSVAYPNWESSIKDFEEGTRKYGIYYSLKLIMNNVYDTTLKIKVHGNAWHQG